LGEFLKKVANPDIFSLIAPEIPKLTKLAEIELFTQDSRYKRFKTSFYLKPSHKYVLFEKLL